MEKYFEAVSHKNRSREDVSKHQAIKLQLQGKQNKKQTNKQTKTRSQESLQTSVCSDTEPEQV